MDGGATPADHREPVRQPHHVGGIASYPTHGLDTAELVAQAHAALVAAHDWTQDRIEVASPPSA